ncbi:hypothetical protein K2173_020057 [Erythroxylum novogranatense]|uniref:CCHC-type domain-containing protein n=1 Tax=Erythroxylum novogranatense TaxID=1862640 RepID=A0AAV8UB74_9ROSI|nr:hypothetical protein K2173_020057 [Erythroxylum novogranatense]
MAFSMTHNNLAEEGNTNNRPPLFNGSNYSSWKNPMKYHIISEGVEYWKIIIFGPHVPLNENGQVKTELEYDDNDWKQAYINAKAMKLIYCALTVEERNRVNSCTSAQEMWERLRITHEGTNQVRETKINMLLHDYEMFVMKEGESISTMLDRFAEIINGLGNLGKHMTDSEKVKKILRSLPKEWDSQVTAIMESKDLNHLEFNALVGSLINYEIILKSRGGRGKPQKSIAFKANTSSVDESDEELDEVEEDEELAMNDDKKKYTMERRTKSYEEKKNNEECWKCGKKGHHARECKSSSIFQKNDRYDKGKKKASLVATWSDDEEAYQSNDENNLALMARSSMTSDDEDEEQAKNDNPPSTWYIDSGCSRHMSGDKNLFAEIKPKNQGYVTFGDNNKGKINGIGKVGEDDDEAETDHGSEAKGVVP